MQVACLVFLFAFLWLGTIIWWRLSHVSREAYIEDIERDRDTATTKKIEAEKHVVSLRKERDDAVEAQLAAEKLAKSLEATAVSQRSENNRVNSDLDAALTVNAALLNRLRANLNAPRPAPWKATVATLLREFGP